MLLAFAILAALALPDLALPETAAAARPKPSAAVEDALQQLGQPKGSKCKPAKVLLRAGYWPGLVELVKAVPWEGREPKCLGQAIDGLEPVKHLVALLDDAVVVRRLAAVGLPLRKPLVGYGTGLAKAARDANDGVRALAAKALGKHPDAATRQGALEGLLIKDKAPTVRMEAARSVGRLGGDWAVVLLERALASEATPKVQRSIQKSLKLAKR